MSTTTTSREYRKALSIAEAAEALSVSQRTIRRLIDGHVLRSFKTGRLRRIPAAEIDKLMGGKQ
ncbi:MAG: excisionase family DNA-binding protein [Actinomycetaceae bacterium]|nr:excisionase family DNA-binding protein [Actinomycetaceae bacterium]MDY6082559.1 excisionase family DNA-binding protein [Actinomycetaceae bacterium]